VLATPGGPGTASTTTSLVGVTAVMMMIMKMIMGLVVVSAGARPTPWLL
jgi:hypothetical protein